MGVCTSPSPRQKLPNRQGRAGYKIGQKEQMTPTSSFLNLKSPLSVLSSASFPSHQEASTWLPGLHSEKETKTPLLSSRPQWPEKHRMQGRQTEWENTHALYDDWGQGQLCEDRKSGTSNRRGHGSLCARLRTRLPDTGKCL